MFYLNNISPGIGSRKKSKRFGRGNGSGKGNYCGRGLNGQNCRTGGGVGPWFEGGQTSLFRRMPKLKGFSNANFKTKYLIIHLDDLEKLSKKGITEINKDTLLNNSIIKNKKFKVKVLGNGEITSKIILKVDKVTASAKEKIQKAGGTIELV